MKKRISHLVIITVFLCGCDHLTEKQVTQIDSLERIYDGKLVQIQINDSIPISKKLKNGQRVLLEYIHIPYWVYAHSDFLPSPDYLKVQLIVKEDSEPLFIHYSHIKEFESVSKNIENKKMLND